MSKIPVGTTPEEVAKTLRQFAELTAKNTRNWDNYESIVLDVFAQIKEHYSGVGEAERSTLAAGVCEYRGGNEHGNPLCLKTNQLI